MWHIQPRLRLPWRFPVGSQEMNFTLALRSGCWFGGKTTSIWLKHQNHLSNQKNPGWLGNIGDDNLPRFFFGIIINHFGEYFFVFIPKIGEDEPILTHIFQIGWNPPTRNLFGWSIRTPFGTFHLTKGMILNQRDDLNQRHGWNLQKPIGKNLFNGFWRSTILLFDLHNQQRGSWCFVFAIFSKKSTKCR